MVEEGRIRELDQGSLMPGSQGLYLMFTPESVSCYPVTEVVNESGDSETIPVNNHLREWGAGLG